MKIWLTTDTHFFHKKMGEYCGRPDGFEELIFQGLQAIPEEDIMIHLGDVCIGRDGEAHERFIQPLLCKKILVMGNHDRQKPTWYASHGFDEVFESVGVSLKDGRRVLLTHKPSAKLDNYSFNVHGHYHNKAHRKDEAESFYSEKHRNLSIEETNYKPVLLEDFINQTL